MRPLNQDNEEMTPESPNLPGNGTENVADEANILSDQDETLLANPADNDANLGGDGSDEVGLDTAEFARGEIDVKEAMDRASAIMDAGHHRPRDPNVTPHSPEGNVDTATALQEAMRNTDNRH